MPLGAGMRLLAQLLLDYPGCGLGVDGISVQRHAGHTAWSGGKNLNNGPETCEECEELLDLTCSSALLAYSDGVERDCVVYNRVSFDMRDVLDPGTENMVSRCVCDLCAKAWEAEEEITDRLPKSVFLFAVNGDEK